MIFNPEGFVVDKIDSVDKMVGNWDFFQEGFLSVNNLFAVGDRLSEKEFMSVLCDILSMREGMGMTVILRSKNDKPLCFLVCMDNSTKYKAKKTLLVYALYSNGKSRSATKWLNEYISEWARGHKYSELHCFSPRVPGVTNAAFRLFEKHFGFRRRMVFFTKTL